MRLAKSKTMTGKLTSSSLIQAILQSSACFSVGNAGPILFWPRADPLRERSEGDHLRRNVSRWGHICGKVWYGNNLCRLMTGSERQWSGLADTGDEG